MTPLLTTTEMQDILAKHALWLAGDPTGRQADLNGADLRGAKLSRADLSRAKLRWTKLRGADLQWTKLRGADLRGADLRWADLSRADLSRAKLIEAELRGAKLRWVDLSRAELRRADLSDADLVGANISRRTPLYADTKRKYVLYVLPECAAPMFIAGCRCFTEAEARAHWGAGSERAQPEYIAAIDRWKASL